MGTFIILARLQARNKNPGEFTVERVAADSRKGHGGYTGVFVPGGPKFCETRSAPRTWGRAAASEKSATSVDEDGAGV